MYICVVNFTHLIDGKPQIPIPMTRVKKASISFGLRGCFIHSCTCVWMTFKVLLVPLQVLIGVPCRLFKDDIECPLIEEQAEKVDWWLAIYVAEYSRLQRHRQKWDTADACCRVPASGVGVCSGARASASYSDLCIDARNICMNIYTWGGAWAGNGCGHGMGVASGADCKIIDRIDIGECRVVCADVAISRHHSPRRTVFLPCIQASSPGRSVCTYLADFDWSRTSWLHNDESS